MVNQNPNMDHRRFGASCNLCTVLTDTPDACAMRKGILSKYETVPDYAKYGCVKYRGPQISPTRKTARSLNMLLGELLEGRILVRSECVERYGISVASFDSIVTRLRNKGYKIERVGEERSYALINTD